MISENHVHLGLACLGTYYYTPAYFNMHPISYLIQHLSEAENHTKEVEEKVDHRAHIHA